MDIKHQPRRESEGMLEVAKEGNKDKNEQLDMKDLQISM